MSYNMTNYHQDFILLVITDTPHQVFEQQQQSSFGTRSHFNEVTIIPVAVCSLDSSTFLCQAEKHRATTALFNIKQCCKDGRRIQRQTKQACR